AIENGYLYASDSFTDLFVLGPQCPVVQQPPLRLAGAAPRVLIRAWPNPTRGATLLEASSLVDGVQAPFLIYDVAGRLVRELSPNGANPSPGALWDGRDRQGAPVAAGEYFVRLRGPMNAATRVTVVK